MIRKNVDTSSYRYLIWIGSDQEKTFGPTISGLIHDNLGPERVTLWDSKQRGSGGKATYRLVCEADIPSEGSRPDIMKLISEVYRSWGAEVVFITSNYQGNQEMMEGCKAAGIPAFVRHLDFLLCIGSILTLFNEGNLMGLLTYITSTCLRTLHAGIEIFFYYLHSVEAYVRYMTVHSEESIYAHRYNLDSIDYQKGSHATPDIFSTGDREGDGGMNMFCRYHCNSKTN